MTGHEVFVSKTRPKRKKPTLTYRWINIYKVLDTISLGIAYKTKRKALRQLTGSEVLKQACIKTVRITIE
jgi:hypothetical protein